MIEGCTSGDGEGEGGDGVMGFSALPSSIVAPGCGTIVEIDCPLISTAI